MPPPTVMGPASNVSKGLSPTDPPVLHPSLDLQECRRNVSRWVDAIAAAAEKVSDRMYKTVFSTLANRLYECTKVSSRRRASKGSNEQKAR